jgi:hypothetical protein
MKSDRFKEKANTFNVILRSQNINLNDLKKKIDKYSGKFLNILERVLLEELRNMLPTGFAKINIRNHNYCKNKHQKILQNVDLSDDDSCLSELEDEIMKTCQVNQYRTPVRQSSNTSMTEEKVEKPSKPKANDIFIIKKEIKEEVKTIPLIMPTTSEVDLNLTCANSSSFEKDNNSIKSVINVNSNVGLSGFKNFIEESQNCSLFKPIMYLNGNNDEKMDIDSEHLYSTNSITSLESVAQVKVDPRQDPSSNYNAYRRKFIPPVNKFKEKLKDQVPFLKDFNPKFLKKENIDKKILRKFRNFVKQIYKDSKDYLMNFDIEFWKDFSNLNLLPPMKYSDAFMMQQIEFKSFNIKYMLWLFSKSGTVELYRDFSAKQGNELLQSFIDAYDLTNTKEEGIVGKLKYYIDNIPNIYSTKTRKLSIDNGSLYNFSVTTHLQSEDVLDHYLGDFKNTNNTFRLNNFENIVYPSRCGKDAEDYNNEGGFNFDMNCSMDSIQSVE